MPRATRSDGRGAPNVGVDVGATLAKVVLRTPDRGLEFQLAPAGELDRLAELLEERARTFWA